MKLSLLLLTAASAGAATLLNVCCGCGNDASAAAALKWQDPFHTIHAAQLACRTQSGACHVVLSGHCVLDFPLGFTDEDVGDAGAPHVWTSVAAAAAAGVEVPAGLHIAPGSSGAAVISGGVPVPSSALSPVVDPNVLATLPPVARGNVLQLNLTSLGVQPGALQCRSYLGGDACILPALLRGTGAELFFYGDPTIAGDASPLTLARYPNRDFNTTLWTNVTSLAVGALAVDTATAARLPAWAAQAAADPSSAAVHFMNYGWADQHALIASVQLDNSSLALEACDGEPFDSSCQFGTCGILYAYNLLCELDEPGEYVVNATTGMVYVWPPNDAYWAMSDWGMPVAPARTNAGSATAAAGAGAWVSSPLHDDPIVAAVSVQDALVVLTDVSGLTFAGITFTFTRGVAINAFNASFITLQDVVVENAGIVGVNITGGQGIVMSNCSVRHTGNGGVTMYAGDRVTLTPSQHTLIASSVSYTNRYMYCYAPLVTSGDCGNSIIASELYGAAHMGVFFSGNLHELTDSTIHDVVQVTRDSGAVYTGRDWSYQGTRILRNAFSDVNSVLGPGNDVTAIYLDDMVSGYIIVNNTFNNTARALQLGGGRSNVFIGNNATNTDGQYEVIEFDNRGMTWGANSCNVTANGILVQLLNRVPYNTSAVWIAAFPQLVNVLTDDPCRPKYNNVSDNYICGSVPGTPWINASPENIADWNSTAVGNVNVTVCA